MDVIFANIRELPDESLRAQGTTWKVVIDFPFDAGGHTPSDDLARLEGFRSRSEPSFTMCWVPAFFTRDTLRDLGTLVILDHVLPPERFRGYAAHLSQVEQASARSLLDNQRSQLQQRIIACLEGAYAVATPPPGTPSTPRTSRAIASSRWSRASSRDRRLVRNLRAAFEHLLGQMLAYQYPAHPEFETEIRPAVLRRVYQEAQRAAQAPDGRIIVERDLRPLLRQVANPLKLGEMHEDAFILGRYWRDHFLRKAAETGGPISVAKLRRWMEEPRPSGLPKEVQNLVILVVRRPDQPDVLPSRRPHAGHDREPPRRAGAAGAEAPVRG